ncbi:MAG: DUF1553 domain-containing protein [Balneolaceae bacterium]
MYSGCGSGEPELADGEEPLPEIVDYNRHVRGIMSETCFTCHGPDEAAREAGLRLDTEEGAFSPLESDEGLHAIVAGSSRKSEAYQRLISDDPDYMMPPPTSNLSLTDRQIAILKRWIDQGAEYKPHWAFIIPEKTDLPQTNDTNWPENEIDHFVLEKIEEEGIKPSLQADRETLRRRVSFDLTGLPPTLDELDDFLNDDSPNAWEKVVDRLLASDAYGERMATEWLDVARYADTHGYQDDGPNEMWPWREWVIDAFNRNMPFDQFTTWQLAGDLLPEATKEQKLATGFGRAHQQSQEGGIVDEEYRVEYVADRVRTTGTAFLGMTMQCARCHDHKYDPISIKEYYQFGAFFDNINDSGQIPNEGAAGPTILLPDEQTEQTIEYLQEQIEEQERQYQKIRSDQADDFSQFYDDWSRVERPETNGLVAHLDLDKTLGDSVVTVRGNETEFARINGTLDKVEGQINKALEFRHSHFLNLGREFAQFERTDPFSFSFWISPSEENREVPVLVNTGAIFIGYRGYDVSLFNNKVSLRLIHGWPYNSIQVITENKLDTDEWSHVTVSYDGSSKAEGINIYINGEKQSLHTEHDNLFKNIVIPEDAWYSGQNFLVGHRNSFEDLRYEGLKLDDIKIFEWQLSSAEALVLANRTNEVQEWLAFGDEQLPESQKEILFEHYLLHEDAQTEAWFNRIRDLREELSAVTDSVREVMVMEERLNPRTSYIRERGLYSQLGEEVEPGVPASILEFPEEFPQNRLGLARWILHPNNPLTARVLVNRYWQMLFGTGLVDTPDDFGNQGSMPTHLELLDWLAVEFRQGGWDVKSLLKTIVMSATYRQSSKTTPMMRQEDPVNRLLARGPRYRMTAEMIRDNALAASGLLVGKIGGPSVFPYQPKGLWAETTSGRHLTEYTPDEGEGLYRRSLYTFWKRTSPPPGMTTFDAAMRTHPVAGREATSTPLQALHTLNDPIYMEASRKLAERMMKEGGEAIEDQVTFAFRVVTSRSPNDREITRLADLYEQEYIIYQEEPSLADELLSVGESPVDSELDSAELAARTIIASAIFNLDETLSKK